MVRTVSVSKREPAGEDFQGESAGVRSSSHPVIYSSPVAVWSQKCRGCPAGDVLCHLQDEAALWCEAKLC